MYVCLFFCVLVCLFICLFVRLLVCLNIYLGLIFLLVSHTCSTSVLFIFLQVFFVLLKKKNIIYICFYSSFFGEIATIKRDYQTSKDVRDLGAVLVLVIGQRDKQQQ